MEFKPGVEPFHLRGLTDLLDRQLLELVAVGFSVREKIPWSVVQCDAKGEIERIPISEEQDQWREYCTELRSYPEGNAICKYCDELHALPLLKGEGSDDFYQCFGGLWDIVLPVTVAGRPIAVFFGGQKRKKGTDSILIDSISQLSKTYQDLPEKCKRKVREAKSHQSGKDSLWMPDFDKLVDLACKEPEIDDRAMSELRKKLKGLVDLISEVAEHRYQVEDQNRKSRFLDAVASHFIRGFAGSDLHTSKLLADIFEGLKLFAGLHRIYFSCQNPAIGSVDTAKTTVMPPPRGIEEAFEPNKGPAARRVDKIWVVDGDSREIGDIIRRTLQEARSGIMYVRRMRLHGERSVEFVFFDHEEASKQPKAVIDCKAKFLHVFTEHLRSLLQLALEHGRLEEFLASSIHRFKAPIQWAYDAHEGVRIEVVRLTNMITGSESELETQEDNKKKGQESGQKACTHLDSLFSHLAVMNLITHNICEAAGDVSKSVPQKETFDLVTAISSVIEEFRPVALERDIAISLFPPPCEDLNICADKGMIMTVMENLLDNAVKYSMNSRPIEITLKEAGNTRYWRVEVADFGLGVACDEYDLVFKKFFRSIAVRDPKRAIPGSGIGLAVVKAFIEAHGGKVFASSRRGRQGEVRADAHDENWEHFKTIFGFEIPRK